MPTYDYVCDGCEHTFEEVQPFSADPLKTCPKCSEDTLRRLFGTGAAILFKGSGFYETDYRSESYKSAEKADKPAETKSSDNSSSANNTSSSTSTGTTSTAKTDNSTK